MIKQLLSIAFFGTSILASGQYCTTSGPTSNVDSNLGSLVLNGTTGGINYTGCPGVLGVEEYFSQTTTLNAGSSYSLELEFSTCGGNYSCIAEVWIDFNGDYVFDQSESVLTWTGTPPMTPTAYVLNIPASAITGQTRMRVVQAENQTLPMDPCTPFTWGSTTDFLVTIEGGIDCSAYIGDDINTPREVAALPFTENYDNSFCYTNQNLTYNSPDVYYEFATAGHPFIEVSLCGSSFDTYLSIQDKWGNIIASNDDYANCGTTSLVDFSTAGYDTLYAVVEGWNLESGAYTIAIGEGTLQLNEHDIDNFQLYPNPASDKLEISSKSEGTLILINSSGKIVFSKERVSNETINISGLEPGFYVARFKTEQHISDKKIIIQ